MIVYLVENRKNGKRYVGLTKYDLETRWRQHTKDAFYERSNMLLHKAIRKNGAESFAISVLEECATEERIREREKYWIAELKTHVSLDKGYNMTLGGDGLMGYHHTEDAKRRMSEARKGERNPNYGKHWGKTNWTDEEKLIVSQKHSGDGNPMYGKHHSEEVRKRIGEATALNKRKSVVQYTKTGDKLAIFNSMKEAAAAIGAPGLQKISDCCNDRCRSYKGFVWKFLETEKE